MKTQKNKNKAEIQQSIGYLKKTASILLIILAVIIMGCDVLNESNDDDNGNGNGNGSTTSITIRNNTGYSISGIYMKVATSMTWGSNLYGYSALADGTSRAFDLPYSLSIHNEYDFLLTQNSGGGGVNFRKYKVTVSRGMTIAFTSSDLNDGSDLPTITVQNRTGVTFNSVHIKPTVSDDWGASFGSLTNNNDRNATIPIPPTSYTRFDIQMLSSNPTNSYTKNNVLVSDGLVVTYTSLDSDNPLTTLPVIVIQNNTGYSISGIYITKPTSMQWGSNLYNYSSMADGTLRTFILPEYLSEQNIYDIRLTQNSGGGGVNFRKYMTTVSEGLIIPFTISDQDDGNNLPSIIFQNRTGVNANSIHIKPSISSDWGVSFGSTTNNNDRTLDIRMPLSSYTNYDIQMNSTNPTNSYTRYNITISDGLSLMYTSADSDNPLTALPVIVIQNNTGYSISGIYIKPNSSPDWGSNWYNYSSMGDGSSRTFTLPNHLTVQNRYDIRLTQNSNGSGTTFIKNNILITEGIVITFTINDLQ